MNGGGGCTSDRLVTCMKIPHVLAFVALGAVAMLVEANLIAPRSLPDDQLARAGLLQKAELPQQAEHEWLNLLEASPLDIDINYRYLNNHFEIPASATQPRDDLDVEQRYQNLLAGEQSADVGYYGLGLIRSLQKRYDEAAPYFEQVKNREQKYLNNSLGRVYLQIGEFELAEQALRREIALGGNVAGAVANLETLYARQNNSAGMRSLAIDAQTAGFASLRVRREAALAGGDLNGYVDLVFLGPLRQMNLTSALCALLICLMWFVYLWRVDLFAQARPQVALACLLLGAISPLCTAPLADALGRIIPLAAGGPPLYDLVYYVLHVGLVEEVVKFLPVLLVVLVAHRADEPVDLLRYGGLSALGFATLENSLYFSGFGLSIVVGRFLISTTLHMSMTGLVCFTWARARQARLPRRVIALYIGGALALAAAGHGLFDTVIMAQANTVTSLSVVCALGLARLYGIMVGNLPVASPGAHRHAWLYGRLGDASLIVAGMISLLGISYSYNVINFSTAIANEKLLTQGGAILFFSLVTFAALGALSRRRRADAPS